MLPTRSPLCVIIYHTLTEYHIYGIIVVEYLSVRVLSDISIYTLLL